MIIELENQEEPLTEEEMNSILCAIDMLEYNGEWEHAEALKEFISKLYNNAM